jgi:hypothetical protein
MTSPFFDISSVPRDLASRVARALPPEPIGYTASEKFSTLGCDIE